MKSLHYYIIAIFWALPKLLTASFGQNAAVFLAEPMGVRPMGMAGAFSAMADDESSIQSNPAGLSKVRGFTLGGGQLVGQLGLQASHLSLVTGIAPRAALGIEAAYLYDSDTYRDAFGNENGSFNNSNLLADLALGASLGGSWRLGGGIKALQESYASNSSLALAADLGIQGPVWHSLRFGVLAQNLGSQLQSQSRPVSTLPLRIQTGISLPVFIREWRLNLEAQGMPNEGQVRSLVGTELGLELGDTGKDGEPPLHASLRAGFASGLAFGEAPRTSFGAGLLLPPTYAIDYALVSVGDLGASHRLSLALRFPGASLPAPPASALAAPYGIRVTEEADGILLSWEDPNDRVDGYNLYADYGVMADRVNAKPVKRRFQKLTHVDRSRTYRFYLKPLGSDGKEGPASDAVTYRSK